MVDYRAQAQFDEQSPEGHEPNVLKLSGIVIFGVALVGTGLLTLGILTLVMNGFSREAVGLRALAPPRFQDKSGLFPSPRLQPDPNVELVAMRKQALGQLNGYGWVDRKAGVAHIPVDRAMEILSTRGLPTTKSAVVEINRVPVATVAPPPTEPAGREPRPERKEDKNPR